MLGCASMAPRRKEACWEGRRDDLNPGERNCDQLAARVTFSFLRNGPRCFSGRAGRRLRLAGIGSGRIENTGASAKSKTDRATPSLTPTRRSSRSHPQATALGKKSTQSLNVAAFEAAESHWRRAPRAETGKEIGDGHRTPTGGLRRKRNVPEIEFVVAALPVQSQMLPPENTPVPGVGTNRRPRAAGTDQVGQTMPATL